MTSRAGLTVRRSQMPLPTISAAPVKSPPRVGETTRTPASAAVEKSRPPYPGGFLPSRATRVSVRPPYAFLASAQFFQKMTTGLAM